MPRLLNLRDPTFLSIALCLAAMLLLPGPLDQNWHTTPRETQWLVMLAPLAVAGLVAASNRALAIAAFLTTFLFFWPGYLWGLGPWSIIFRCRRMIPSVSFGWLFLWSAFLVMLALITRAVRPTDRWGTLLARGGIAIAAMLASADALEMLDRAMWIAPPKVQDAVLLAQYWIPPIVLCALLWRRWTGLPLWIGATAASFLWTAEMIFELNGLRWQDYPALGLGAAVGPLWAWYDYRRHAAEHWPKGFEVAPAPRRVLPLSQE